MDDLTRRKVEENLFSASQPAVEPWDQFPWHRDRQKRCDTWKPHSSQALAIDVFGWLKVISQEERDTICNAVAGTLTLPQSTGWQVDVEWIDPKARLGDNYLLYKQNVPRWVPRLKPWEGLPAGRSGPEN